MLILFDHERISTQVNLSKLDFWS